MRVRGRRRVGSINRVCASGGLPTAKHFYVCGRCGGYPGMKLYAERFISGRMIHLDCDARVHVITMKTIENGGDFLPTDEKRFRVTIYGATLGYATYIYV